MRKYLPAVLASLLVLGACDESTAPPTGDYASLPADNVVTRLDQLLTNDGVRRAQLRADTAYVFEDSATTQLRGVTLETYDESGRLTSTLTSDEGEFNRDTQKTVARGNVVLVIPDPNGRTVWTEELHYDPTTKRLWSDVATRMLMNTGAEMRGQRFTADDEFRNVNVPGGSGTNLPLPVNRQ